MTVKKDFTQAGVAADVQFGKAGGRFIWAAGSRFESTAADGVTLAQIRVPTTPLNANDAASKAYVDGLAAGVDAKASVRAATTVAGTLATSFENGDTIDGVVLATGDRILIKNQASAIENGIYVVNATGAPTRSTDADAVGEISGGTFVFVEEGTTNADTGWVVSSNGVLTPGTDPINWVQFSSAGLITAGIGLTQSGNVFNVNVGAATIAVNGGDDLIVNSSAVAGQTLLSAGTVGTQATWGALDLALTAATTGLLPGNRGGLATDVSAFANGTIFLANGAGAVTALAPATNGNVLRIAAGLPAYGTISLADNVNTVTGILDETNGGTGNSTYVVGDLLIGTGVDTLGKIAIGLNGQVLQSNGTTATWVTPPSSSGAVVTRQVTVPLNSAATTAVGTTVPAGAYVLETSVRVTTASDAATTVVVGDAGVTDRLMVATANDPESAFNYVTEVQHLYAAITQINVIVATPGTVGSAIVTVRYIAP